MSEDGEKDKGKAQKRASRPVTAAARRERRASEGSSGTGTGKKKDATKRPAPKGKASGKAGETAGKERPTPPRTSQDTKRESLFVRLRRFIREVVAELRKVHWPTRKQMVTYTIVVLVFVAFMIALVYGLDAVFLRVMDFIFG